MSKFQTKIINKLEKQGFTVIKTIRLNKSGYPDILAMKKNQPDLWIEAKEPGDTLKPLQKRRINQLNELGKNAFCLHSEKGLIYPEKEDFKKIIANIFYKYFVV